VAGFAFGHAGQPRVSAPLSVRYLVRQGITQFLDIGSGIPTEGNVHEVAQAAAPEPEWSMWTSTRSPLRTAGLS
jgi:hypothetical protein